MDADTYKLLTPGTPVKVTQQIAARDRTWVSEVRGAVVRFDRRQTGSWFAHSKNDKLWLDRLLLRKPDGELTTLILDNYSHIEIEPEPPTAPASEQEPEPAPTEPAAAA